MKCFQTNSGSLFRLFRVRHVRSSWGECSPSLSVQTILPSTIPWQLTMRPNVRGLQTFWWDSLDDICPRTILEGSFFLFPRIKKWIFTAWTHLKQGEFSERVWIKPRWSSLRFYFPPETPFEKMRRENTWSIMGNQSPYYSKTHTYARMHTHTKKIERVCSVIGWQWSTGSWSHITCYYI